MIGLKRTKKSEVELKQQNARNNTNKSTNNLSSRIYNPKQNNRVYGQVNHPIYEEETKAPQMGCFFMP